MVEIASKTQGLSGADLQALVYNAHLDVVHASIAEQSQKKPVPNGNKGGASKEDPVKYRQVAPVSKESISRADRSAMENRVSRYSPGHGARRKLIDQIETIVSNSSKTRATHGAVKMERPIVSLSHFSVKEGRD
jgi:peroxin-1